MVNCFGPTFYPVWCTVRRGIFLKQGESFTAAHVRDHSRAMIGFVQKCNWLCCNIGCHIGFHRNFSKVGNIDILFIFVRLLTTQSKWTFTKRFTLCTPHRKYPMLLQQSQKMRFVGSNIQV